MIDSTRNTLLLIICAGVLAGCLPRENRTTTKVKSAGDVKITAGKGQVVELPSEPASPSPAVAPAAPAVAPAAVTGARPSEMPVTAAPVIASPAVTSPAPATTASAAQASADGVARWKGRVTISGAPPSLALKVAKGSDIKDKEVCAANDVPDVRFVSSADGGLGNVIIFMAKAPASGVPAPTGDAPVLDQKGCVFLPHITICRIGQPISLLNSDPVAHNVNFTGLSDQFNQILGQDQTANYEFKKAARLPIPVKCDIHGWMSAHILPLDHPWAAVTDEKGNFEISNLPAGEHAFVVWHEAAGYIERSLKVNVSAGQVTDQSIPVEMSKLKFE